MSWLNSTVIDALNLQYSMHINRLYRVYVKIIVQTTIYVSYPVYNIIILIKYKVNNHNIISVHFVLSERALSSL